MTGREPAAPAPSGKRAPARAGQDGFTLIELLVAMALLSMVGLALVGLGRFQLAAVGRLTVAAVAAIEADNMAADALLARAAPPPGAGAASNAGVMLAWTRMVAPGPAGMVAVTVAVGPADGAPLATRTVVRAA